jgi:hypothetical protein
MRTFGIMTAIIAGLSGIIWALAEYGASKTCSLDALGRGYCYPTAQDLHPVIAPTVLTATAVAVIVVLLVAPRRAAASANPGSAPS